MSDFTNNGVCSRCGQCCSNFIPLTAEEVQRLREICKRPDTMVQIKTIPDGRVMMLCPFLIMHPESNFTECSIYEERPSVCRIFKCDEKKKFTAEESKDYKVVDLMKDIVGYDYRKENNMTYEEAMNYHIAMCLKDDKDGK